MKNKKTVLMLMLLGSLFYNLESIDQQTDFAFNDRAAWSSACAKLPKNIDVNKKNRYQSGFSQNSIFSLNRNTGWKEFDIALDKFLHLSSEKLKNSATWVGQKPNEDFYDLEKNKFLPYAEKLELKPGQRVVFHGDFHGDIHSFHAELEQLEQQKILKPGSFELADKNVHLTFLGDYVDRGNYGAEVIYTLLRLKLANPDNVLMVRGNHEDSQVSDRYGFKDELKVKFGSDEEKYKKIYRLYDFLPVVAYVGHDKNFLQCCHGGLEYGYQPKELLNGAGKFDLIGGLKRGKFKNFLEENKLHHDACACHDKDGWHKHKEAFNNYIPVAPVDQKGSLGFMWGDFVKKGPAIFAQGRGLAANEDLAKAVLDFQNEGSDKKVRGVFRAHQHSGSIEQNKADNLMYELIKSNGVYCLWKPIETGKERSLKDGLVWTFNVAPDGSIGKHLKFGFDAYAILTVAKKYEDWKLAVHNPQIIDRPDYKKPQI